MNKITIDQFIAILSQRDAPDATEVPDVSRHLKRRRGLFPVGCERPAPRRV